MKAHATRYAGRLHRKMREFWPDRNPLRRRWDRVETAVIAGLVLVFLAGGALAALTAGRLAYEGALHARHAELATLHEVPAVLLTAAVRPVGGFSTSAEASWQAPDGQPRTGLVSPPAGSAAGTTIEVWVDAGGRAAAAPLQPAQVQGQGVLASVLAVMVVAVALCGSGLVAHRMAERRRMAAWDDEWRAAGPRWSRYG